MSERDPATSKPIRCIHFLPTIRVEQGGVVRAVLDMCTVLSSRGHDVTLMTWDPSDCPQEWKDGKPGYPKVVVVAKPRSVLWRLDAASLAMAEKVLKSGDLVHLHGAWGTSNLQLADIARRLGVPYIASIHGMLDDWSMHQRRRKKRLFLFLRGRAYLENAAAVHCTAEAEVDQAKQWFPRGRPVVLPYIFDLEPFRQLPGPELAQNAFSSLKLGEPVLLFLSRVHPKKGVETLIRASGILRRQGFRHRVLIAGPSDAAYAAQLGSLVKSEGVEDAVEFVGTVRGEEKLSLYQAATIFVLPTSQENFGLVLFEALACGTPVITTYGVDVWKELQDAGATVIEQSPLQLAKAIQDLLLDSHRPQEIGALGRHWVFDTLASDRVASGYEAMYREAIRGGAGRNESDAQRRAPAAVFRPELKPPIVIVGPMRSGKSTLARLLASAPGHCVWEEPNALWQVGHAYRERYELGAEDATPWVKQWIRDAFLRYQEQHGGARVIVESPNAALKMPFLAAVLPEAKFVHYFRDARVSVSLRVDLQESKFAYSFARPETWPRLQRQLSYVPWWEMPAYLPRVVRGFVRRYFVKGPTQWVGFTYPGWKKDLKRLTPTQIAAKQWVVGIQATQKALRLIPRERWMEVRFEALSADPENWFRQLTTFCGISVSESYYRIVSRQVRAMARDVVIDERAMHDAMPLLEPALRELKYD